MKDSERIPNRECPVLFAKFLRREILGEQGRLLFSLLNTFALSEYRIRLFDSLPNQDLGKYGHLAYSLERVTLTNSVPAETAGMIYLFDEEDKAVGAQAWHKKLQVKFDIFSPYWFADPILMPFPVHPVHAGPDLRNRLEKYRAAEKRVRIFFSGHTQGYVKSRMRYPKEKLPRQEVINAIMERMGNQSLVVSDQASLDGLYSTDVYTSKCVLVDANHLWIDDRRWMSTLAKADFFLCPPGYVMPMCHNAIEAMAVGAIPIINYPEWFDPHLRHLETCIVFDDKNDLIEKLNDVLAMSEQRVGELRQRVIQYYETHLSPESFAHRVATDQRRKVTVLMITEPAVAQNASRFNRRSIVLRGTSMTSGRGWLGMLRSQRA